MTLEELVVKKFEDWGLEKLIEKRNEDPKGETAPVDCIAKNFADAVRKWLTQRISERLLRGD